MDKHVEGFCLQKLGNRASLSTVPLIAVLKMHFGLNTENRLFIS